MDQDLDNTYIPILILSSESGKYLSLLLFRLSRALTQQDAGTLETCQISPDEDKLCLYHSFLIRKIDQIKLEISFLSKTFYLLIFIPEGKDKARVEVDTL